jgi:CubicO group peptidase (beta-lactamase class C family)
MEAKMKTVITFSVFVIFLAAYLAFSSGVTTGPTEDHLLSRDRIPDNPRMPFDRPGVKGYPEPERNTDDRNNTWLDTYIDSIMQVYCVPGVAACVVKGGEIIWTATYGYANIEQNIPVTDSTLFGLASVSKTVVATAVMQLCEDGYFALDDDINDYLDFTVVHPQYPDSAITFRMLLTHTSCIVDNWSVLDPLLIWGGDSPIPLGEFLEDYLTPGGAYYNPSANFLQYWCPGTYWIYCNVTVALAAYLVEVVTGLDFEQYCQENIFQPLSMNETSWFLANLDTNHVATPYYWNGIAYVPYQHYGYPYYPAAQLRTSSIQLARHLLAFGKFGQVDSVRILDSTTVVEMRTIQFPGLSPDQCLIWFTEFWGGYWTFFHIGEWYGIRNDNSYQPDENWGTIVLTNGESATCRNLIVLQLFEFASGYTSLACNLTPLSIPVVIPAGGGSFDCTIDIENETDSTAVFDVWIDATLPSGSTYGPIILREDVTLPAYGLITRQLTQNVPAGAPAGEYSYNAYVGEYPQYAWNESSFPFTKEAGDQGEMLLSEWQVSGWEEEQFLAEEGSPDSFVLCPAHPNPFNPLTAISFQLPALSFVNLTVYDVSGRLVATLANGWLDAGVHEVTFDGSGLASGVYVYLLEAGEFTASEKMVLIK